MKKEKMSKLWIGIEFVCLYIQRMAHSPSTTIDVGELLQ